MLSQNTFFVIYYKAISCQQTWAQDESKHLIFEQKQSSNLPELDRDGSEILLAPFLRDLLTYERDDVKDALGILNFPLLFTIECPKQRIPFHQPRQPFSHSDSSSLTDQQKCFLLSREYSNVSMEGYRLKEYSCLASAGACFFLSVVYVASLYIWNSPHNR